MSRGEDYLEYEYLSDVDTIIGVIIKDVIEAGDVAILDSYLTKIMNDHSGFISMVLDVRNLRDLSSPLIGILMMTIRRTSVRQGFLALVMEDDFLKKHMFRYPELFDHYTIFRTIEEAISFIAR